MTDAAIDIRPGSVHWVSELILLGDPRVAAVPVEDCGEDLVDTREVADLLLDDLKVDESGCYAFLRSGLVERLLGAQGQLPDGYRLQLIEGFRPYEVQERYFTSYRSRLEASDPELGSADSYRLASRYVAPPDVAPHVSGAAIDLTLVDAAGRPVDMGTPVNATPEESDGACYFGASNVSSEARHRRAMLAHCLEQAGLLNYPTEWWHWSYGDRYWALLTQQQAAIYGPVRAPDRA